MLLFVHEERGKVVTDAAWFIARDAAATHRPTPDPGERIGIRLITFEELLLLSDEPRFWVHPRFVRYLFELRLDAQKQEVFRTLLFPAR